MVEDKGENKAGLILAPGRSGEDFELRGEFEVESRGNHDRDFSILVTYNEGTQQWLNGHVWQEGAGKMRASIMLKWTDAKQSVHKRHQHTGRTQFLVQLWDGKMSFYLNGEPIQTGFDIEEELDSFSQQSLFGFGNYLFMKDNTTYVRNIEIRRLTSEPLAPEQPK